MSKKKATMTLKDFHGGSIPSDLTLPSAPGVTVRPMDGRGFDRQIPVGRSDQRLRPGSAGSARNLDDNTPFLSDTSHIGRNFEEDERKPLGGVSGPRRTVGDENTHSQSSHGREPIIGSQSGAKVGSRPASVPMSQIASGSTSSSYAGRVSTLHNTRSHHQTSNYPIIGGKGETVVAAHQNAWGIRKETVTMRDPVTTAWSAPDAAVKLANASALEKVSSGLWSSKQQVHTLNDAEVFGHRDTQGQLGHNQNTAYDKKMFNRIDVMNDTDHYDVALAMRAERSLVIDDGICAGGKGVPSYDMARTTIHVEPSEQNTSNIVDGFQSCQLTGISGGAEYQATLPSKRPKLKLLPRSKPIENSGQIADYNQESKQIRDHLVENKYFVQEPKNPVQSGLSGPVLADRAPERPKLNLKPRSQSLEQLEGNSEGKRGTIFGEARPREVVLKERGMEDDVDNYDSQLPLRGKDGVPKAEKFMHVTPVRYTEKAESIPADQRIANYSDRRDHQAEGEKIDSQRNRQNEIRRNSLDAEKHQNLQQKQLHDLLPSPETWHKPVEQAKSASSDTPPLQYGKAASAVEIAQAFSKSLSSSDPAAVDCFSGPKGIPGHSNQIPFSRLMGPTPRPQASGR